MGDKTGLGTNTRPVSSANVFLRLLVRGGSTGAACIAMIIGAWWLYMWFTGKAAELPLERITPKTNAAFALFLGGFSLSCLCLPRTRIRIWAGGVAAFIVMVTGFLTLLENLFGWDIHIDQLLANEPMGMAGVTSPNRMGLPASTSFTLIGAGLLALVRRRPRALPSWLGLIVCIISFVPLVGYLYGIQTFHEKPRVTAIALPTILGLVGLGIGLMLAQHQSGPTAMLLRNDSGGRLLRRTLPAAILVPLALGYLKMGAEHAGYFDPYVRTGMLVIALVLVFSAVLWQSAASLSRSSQMERQSEARFQSLFEQSLDGIYAVDLQGRFMLANSAAEKISGYSAAELREMLITDLCVPESRMAAEQAFRNALAGQANEEEITIHRKDGQLVQLLVSGSPISSDGRITGVFGVARDMTERMRAEQELASVAQFPEENPQPVFRISSRGELLFRNRAAVSLLNPMWGEKGLTGPLAVTLQDTLKTGNTHEVEIEYNAGKFFQFVCVPFADKQYVNFYGRDITEARRAQDALLHSEQRLRATFDNAGVGIVEVDSDSRFIAVNGRVCQILGYRREDLLGMTVHELTAPEDQSQSDQMNELLHARKIDRIDYEKRYLRADGTRLWVHVMVSPVCDSTGRVVRAIATVEDISERKRAQQLVEQQRAQLEAVYHAMADGLMVFDMAGNAILVNDAEARLCGYPGTDDMKRDLAYFARSFELAQLDGRVLPVDQWPVSRVLRGESLTNWELKTRRLDTRKEWVISFTGEPVLDSHGNQILAVIVSRDITESKRAEQALQASEERLRLAQQVGGIGAFEWDIPTDTSVWTREMKVIYGFTNDDDSPTSYVRWRESVHPDDRSRVQEYVANALITGRLETEWRVIWPDGTVRWVAGRGQVFKDDNGRPVRMVGVNMDITERKKFEEELAAAKTSAETAKLFAEQANQAKDQFLAVLSHELRTPLTPVLTAAHMMLEDAKLSEEQNELVEMVRRNVELEARLIDDLLDLTRITRGKLEMHLAKVNVHEKLRQVVAMCEEDIRPKRLDLQIRPKAVKADVLADATRLQQVLWNLLKNAVKFTPPTGQIIIETDNPAPEQISISVTDTGIGITPDMLPRIFNAFEQGGRQTTQQFGGLGLGLAICKGLVKLHGGTITAFSAGHDSGATFTITLPILVEDISSPRATGSGTAAAADVQHRRHLLLVEDHADTAILMARVLKKANFDVRITSSVAEAIQAAQEERIDVLISDIGLPDGSGIELMQRLRKQLQHPFVSIAVSGYGMEEDVRRSREAGFSAHLVKPVSLKTLRQTIDELLNTSIAPTPTTP